MTVILEILALWIVASLLLSLLLGRMLKRTSSFADHKHQTRSKPRLVQ